MPVAVWANESGSVGKTTLAVCVATLAAQSGRMVRLVDLDPQANASFYLGCNGADRQVGDVLLRRPPRHGGRHRATTLEDVELKTDVLGLTVVPATSALKADVLELHRTPLAEMRLAKALENASPVDLTFIDCPGTAGVLTLAALIAAESVLTATRPSIKEAIGIAELLDTIDTVQRDVNSHLRLAAIVPNEVPSSGNIYRDTLDTLHSSDDYRHLVTPAVRRSVLVPESYSHQVPLPLYQPRSDVSGDCVAVYDWLLTHGVIV
jgi:chromosome partitioning protein